MQTASDGQGRVQLVCLAEGVADTSAAAREIEMINFMIRFAYCLQIGQLMVTEYGKEETTHARNSPAI